MFVATGGIDDMWIRDSAVQLSIYFPHLAARPALRRILEGAMRAQAPPSLHPKAFPATFPHSPRKSLPFRPKLVGMPWNTCGEQPWPARF